MMALTSAGREKLPSNDAAEMKRLDIGMDSERMG
jgi:hypothetical protein